MEQKPLNPLNPELLDELQEKLSKLKLQDIEKFYEEHIHIPEFTVALATHQKRQKSLAHNPAENSPNHNSVENHKYKQFSRGQVNGK